MIVTIHLSTLNSKKVRDAIKEKIHKYCPMLRFAYTVIGVKFLRNCQQYFTNIR